MKLYSSMASPFGRKVKIAAALLGLTERIEVVKTDTLDADDPIRGVNPLGKIPALVMPNGQVLYDSRVIVEYLDYIAGGGRIVPRESEPRYATLALQALADGILDAALLQVYETRFRAEGARSAAWVAHQQGKVARALDHLEQRTPGTDWIAVGEITVACALGYLDLRFAGSWRDQHPRLGEWLQRFSAKVPAFEATKPA